MIWSCLWGGGIAWMLHLMTVWVAAEFGCISGLGVPGAWGISQVAWLVIGLSGLCFGLAGLASYASWRWCPRTAGNGAFVYRYGIAANPIFMLIIVAQTLPVFFHLKDCGNVIG